MEKFFCIISFVTLPCGAMQLHGVAEFSHHCTRDAYKDHRELFRKQQPEGVSYLYEVVT